jgi:hypothetical protein
MQGGGGSPSVSGLRDYLRSKAGVDFGYAFKDDASLAEQLLDAAKRAAAMQPYEGVLSEYQRNQHAFQQWLQQRNRQVQPEQPAAAKTMWERRPQYDPRWR